MAELGNDGHASGKGDAVKAGVSIEAGNVVTVLQWGVSVFSSQCVLFLADTSTAMPENMMKNGQEANRRSIELLVEAMDSGSLWLLSILI